MDQGRRKFERREENSIDYPMYSRLFIVCERSLTQEDFRNAFSSFGTIEDIRIPCDNSGASKGLAYLKFSKTSEAAMALESMHLQVMRNSRRPLKVMVAANRNEVVSDDCDKHRRLFITVPRIMTENEIEQEFIVYGQIQTILLQRDHNTGESKGFAYITYSKFSEAAKAIEECDKKYRCVFAKPKEQRRPETMFESHINNIVSAPRSYNQDPLISLMDNVPHSTYTRVNFMCCPNFTQGHMERLFDLVPGMVRCKYFVDQMRNVGKGTVSYSNPRSAAYAVEKLNEFQYPPGMLIFVKPDNFGGSKVDFDYNNDYSNVSDSVSKLKNAISVASSSSSPDLAQLAEAIAEASKLIKKATGTAPDISGGDDLSYCSVKLPPPQPLADIDNLVAKRCFLVCKPAPPPLSVLRDVFCRFGDLINVYTLPNKTVGYARYASEKAADEAISVLHGAEICGVRMKVLEAEEEAPPRKRERID